VSIFISYPSSLILPRADNGAIARRRNGFILLAGHLSLFPEAVQYVDGFLELGDVHYAVDAACVPDANLSCPGTHIVERFPVAWIKPGLDLPQLEARFFAGIFWECQQIVVGRSYPTNLLFIFHKTGMYKILYAPAGASQGARRRMLDNDDQLSVGGPVKKENSGVGKLNSWGPTLVGRWLPGMDSNHDLDRFLKSNNLLILQSR
jgi:hypothetical protein